MLQATFLVLFRRSGTIRDADALANWLHGVARRLAVGVRNAEARTKFHASEHVIEDDRWLELSAAFESGEFVPILYEEVERLPEHYREPVLLQLEGKSHEEAAVVLSVPIGTIKGRLSRARGLLRERLVRRGVAISAFFLALWRSSAASAASASRLKTSTALSTTGHKAMSSLSRRTIWMIVALLMMLVLLGIECQSIEPNQGLESDTCRTSGGPQQARGMTFLSVAEV